MSQIKAARLLYAAVVAIGAAPGAALAAAPHLLGTIRADVPSAHELGRSAVAATVSAPSAKYTSAQYATGGVALRNRGVGVINISGAVAPIQAGYLYFADLFSGSAPATLTVNLAYIVPGTALHGHNLTLKLIGTGGDPCWGSSGIGVYKAKVPASEIYGNGSYVITLNSTETALTTGEDPWDGNVQYPLAEGASLVLIGTGSATVGVYDTTIPSGTTFADATYGYTLKLPAAAPGNQTLFDSIGADGQVGDSRIAETSNTTTVAGTVISGSGGIDPTGDFAATSGLPLPQLWDDNGHDITSLVGAGATTVAIGYTSGDDCITTIANVVSVQ
jgi:hypothetical protein